MNDPSHVSFRSLLGDPNVWGASRLVSLRMVEHATDWLLRRSAPGMVPVEDIAAAMVGMVRAALVFADMIGIQRSSVEGMLRRVLDNHYAPENSSPPPLKPVESERINNVISIRRDERS